MAGDLLRWPAGGARRNVRPPASAPPRREMAGPWRWAGRGLRRGDSCGPKQTKHAGGPRHSGVPPLRRPARVLPRTKKKKIPSTLALVAPHTGPAPSHARAAQDRASAAAGAARAGEVPRSACGSLRTACAAPPRACMPTGPVRAEAASPAGLRSARERRVTRTTAPPNPSKLRARSECRSARLTRLTIAPHQRPSGDSLTRTAEWPQTRGVERVHAPSLRRLRQRGGPGRRRSTAFSRRTSHGDAGPRGALAPVNAHAGADTLPVVPALVRASPLSPSSRPSAYLSSIAEKRWLSTALLPVFDANYNGSDRGTTLNKDL
ncbi:hypothetical protein AcW1_006810 [Taiwanofungus camphoratus]|nr:hypothetical protein AcW1_006810 [Antrodia cinnamomea]